MAAKKQATSTVTRAMPMRLWPTSVRKNSISLPEMPLRCGRRADMMGIDAKGRIVIVEIKVSRTDLLGDAKWPDYLDYCDRFYWGLPPGLDRQCLETEAFLPDRCGLILADGYGAEILREAPDHPLAAARRRKMTLLFARHAAARLHLLRDPAAGV